MKVTGHCHRGKLGEAYGGIVYPNGLQRGKIFAAESSGYIVCCNIPVCGKVNRLEILHGIKGKNFITIIRKQFYPIYAEPIGRNTREVGNCRTGS